MSQYTLTYFNGEGLGEAIRLLLSYGKVDFIDKRIESEEWAKVKETAPLGQLPLLEIDGKVLFQSLAIARFLGRKFGLYSEDPMEAYEIDNVVDTINDFRARLAIVHYETDEVVKAKKLEPLKTETIPFYLNKIEALAKENQGFLTLKKLTWADVYLTGMVTYLKSMMKVDKIGENYPNLKKVVENVKAQPGIKEWIEKRPKSEW